MASRMNFICVIALLVGPNIVIGQSLARLKKVTMSSQRGGWKGSRAVDGNYNTSANACECCASTSTSGNLIDQWIQIDFGETYTFNRVVVYGTSDGPVTRRSLGGLELYLDGAATSIATIADSDLGFYHFNLKKKYSARYIKYVLPGERRPLVICEIDVFDDSVISKGSVVLASSTYPNMEASYATDGTIQNIDHETCASTVQEPDPWFSLDLGDRFVITYIHIYGRTDNTYKGQSFEGMTIHIDGKVVDTIPSLGYTDHYELLPTTLLFGKTIKLILHGPNMQFVMCELIVYGDRILSIQAEAKMSSEYYDWKPAHAVDGLLHTSPTKDLQACAATRYQQHAWLRIDLGHVYNVSRIVIYGRTDGHFGGQSFSGMYISLDGAPRAYRIPVSNVWVDFYTVRLTDQRITSTVTLALLGYRIQLVVCEVLVYGDCKAGFYGKTCSKQCRCIGEPCNSRFGVCPSGTCQDGYTGDSCSEKCSPGLFGPGCSQVCRNCKDGLSCDHITGQCSQCEPGYTWDDPACQTECSSETYGHNCGSQCGHCKNGAPCDHSTGHCDECGPGYKPTDRLCKTECERGGYGHDCSQTCGYCKNGVPCDHVTGHCTSCEPGYKSGDLLCKLECEEGQWGPGCSSTCGHCKNGVPCNHVTGYCDSCEPGYEPSNYQCTTVCKSGEYGQNCSLTCGHCKNGATCNHITGVCNNGCGSGYKQSDRFCKTECEEGQWGSGCAMSCGHCKNGVPCNHVTGYCDSCEPGYEPSNHQCTTVCKSGEYGQNCSQTCGHCKNGATCNHITGVCNNGCGSGYKQSDRFCKTFIGCRQGTYGNKCGSQCGHCKDGAPCDHVTGHCNECGPGYKLTDRLCKTACEVGRYGQNCSMVCGHCKEGLPCNVSTGLCEECSDGYKQTDLLCKSECESGTYGWNCSLECGQCKNNQTCDHVTGHCEECEQWDILDNPFCIEGFIPDNEAQTSGSTNFIELLEVVGPITGGGVILVAFVLVLAVCICRRKRRNSRGSEAINAAQTGPSGQCNPDLYDELDLQDMNACG